VTILSMLITLSTALTGASSISGTVINADGDPVASARVFIEQGLQGPLRETQSGADGAFRFDDVRPEMTGVFAWAQGYAFGGRSVKLTIEAHADVAITLARPGGVSGRIVDGRGDAIPNARITRVLLVREPRLLSVGIPLARLEQLGLAVPKTDADGRFTVPLLPQDGKVALKIAHGRYAQEATQPVDVGDQNVRVRLMGGVLLTGQVYLRGSTVAVGNASVVFRNAEPPNQSTVTSTHQDGTFAVRMKPGAYVYEVTGAAFKNAGPERFIISGANATERIVAYVAGVGAIHGKVLDAQTGDPVEGARLVHQTFGTTSAIRYTGPTGEFQFTAMAGENVVQFTSAFGYLGPPDSGIKMMVKEGRVAEVPTFWLLSIPTYSLQVVDEEGAPIPGAVVSVLRPDQFGWRVTDEEGRVELTFGSLPSDGTVVGLVEHPTKAEGALFAIKRSQADNALVTPLPLGQVSGRVVSADGKGLEGAIVDSRYSDESMPESIALWQTVSGADGSFSWDGVVRHVPQAPSAYTINSESGELVQGEQSAPFILGEGPAKDVGNISVPSGVKARSLLGKKLKWQDRPVQCGEAPSTRSLRGTPAVVVYCRPEEAAMMIEGLGVARALLQDKSFVFAVVVDGEFACSDSVLPVFRGEAPGTAATYLLDGKGTVVLETFGMPPLHALNALASAVER